MEERNKRGRKTLNSKLHQNLSLQELDPSSQINVNGSKKESTDEISDCRNWSALSQPILTSILTLLPSIVDVASAASVSRPWYSAALDAFTNNKWAPQRPPLLLNPILMKTALFSLHINQHYPRWAPPHPRWHLIPLESVPTSKPYLHPVLSTQTLAKSTCVGRHHSKLILIEDVFIVLHDVFSGEQIRSSEITCLRDLHIDFGALTAPLHSTFASLVLLVAHQKEPQNYCIISWEPNGNGNKDGKFAIDMEIVSFALFNDQVYYLDSMTRVGVVEFDPEVSLRLLDESMESTSIFNWLGNFRFHLVVCDGELLMVVLYANMAPKVIYKMCIKVYTLDLEKRKWVRKMKLDDCCLFVDAVGKTGFSCKYPERWGGRSNCIYVPGPGSMGYRIYLLNDEDISVSDFPSATSRFYRKLPNCFPPLWVYPNIKSMKELIRSEKAQPQ